MNEIEVIKKKIEYFKKDNIDVHITKKNGYFHNGSILEIESDFLILIDKIDGEMPIFFAEIVEVSKRGERE